MVRITKVYTRQGDKGKTQLAAGKRVAKTSLPIRVLGELDELNAFFGWAAEALAAGEITPALGGLRAQCTRIQNELFDLGAQIAVLPDDRRADTPAVSAQAVTRLEQEIDAMNATLPTLRSFVLPRGGETACRFHIARVVCRRAERAFVTLHERDARAAVELCYLNRLSDWLFVAARYCAAQQGIAELLWTPHQPPAR